MTNMTVRRWARFGHERLYAETPDGTALGYYDLRVGSFHAEDNSDLQRLTQAIEDHLGSEGAAIPGTAPETDVAEESRASSTIEQPPAAVPVPPEAVRAEPVPTEPVPAEPVPAPQPTPELIAPPVEAQIEAPVEVLPDWRDLSENTPGQAAREQAAEEWRVRREEKPVRAVLGRLLNVHTDERAWRIGADGEEAVGNQLDKLAGKDPRWRVLHAVPVGERGSDIDHLVIGPAGVFTINTKHHPKAKIWVGKDQLRVNGHVQPYIRNSRFEARRAAARLSAACGFDVRADALLVFFAVEEISVKTAPGEKDGSSVHVKYRRQSIRWLKRQRTILTDEQIDQIYDQARRSTTWT